MHLPSEIVLVIRLGAAPRIATQQNISFQFMLLLLLLYFHFGFHF